MLKGGGVFEPGFGCDIKPFKNGWQLLVDDAAFIVAYYSSRPIYQVKVVFPCTGYAALYVGIDAVEKGQHGFDVAIEFKQLALFQLLLNGRL